MLAVNSSYTIAPWVDIVFAMDYLFWCKKFYDVKAMCPDAFLCTTTRQPVKGVEFFAVENPGNSGAGAISLAVHLGATKVILLGYDCQYGEKGKRHFFGNHPPGMNGNAGSVHTWPDQFRSLSRRLKGCKIVNSTPTTALKVWPCVPLEDALNDIS